MSPRRTTTPTSRTRPPGPADPTTTKTTPAKDPARAAAFEGLRAVNGDGAYANLILPTMLTRHHLRGRDAGFATELLAGTCRRQGSYDVIIEAASGRKLDSLQPAVVDVLRLGAHQLLSMRVPTHATVSATVDLARSRIGGRVSGLVNAVLRKVAARTWSEWMDELTRGADPRDALALREAHPRWIIDAFADRLPEDQVERLLVADNEAPQVSLAVRPGLATVEELRAAGAEPGRWSPYAVRWSGDPGELPAVAQGRAGVQDEGSQLAALAVTRPPTPPGPWLDLCAGPGGKTALLAGLARDQDAALLATEPAAHRARLVAQAVRGYPPEGKAIGVVVADGTRPAWPERTFARVLADVPCTGLGALRRRPEARWRRTPAVLDELVPLQRRLLEAAIEATMTGGLIGYVTCSPHRAETLDVLAGVLAGRDDVEPVDVAPWLPEIPGLADRSEQGTVQLWPHLDGTDAMFIALLRRVG